VTASNDEILTEVRKLQRGQDRLEMQQSTTAAQVTELVRKQGDLEKLVGALSEFRATFSGIGKGLAFVATIVVPIATFLLFWKAGGK
jgi:hypothetical protein